MIDDNTPTSNGKQSIRYSFAKSNGLLITENNSDHTVVACHPNASFEAIEELRRFVQKPLKLIDVSDDEFSNLLYQIYEMKSGTAVELAENIGEKMDLKELMVDIPKTADLLESENDAPIIALLNALFSEAVKKKASDIHIETFANQMSTRLRIDGVLQPILDLPSVLGPMIISRIKVMAMLNIAEKRLPQDGRITIKIGGSPIDVRVSTLPTNHGERVVLRILNKKAVHLNLNDLGMNNFWLEHVVKMIAKPHGIILVTGPTGSGKTTSLYAMLTELNKPGTNIITIEEPIEYDLPGISQIQVNPKVEMSFARGLRAILRQDPNVVMVGEIRDAETASIAVQASLTGHLVLSTLHTNTAIGAITRLRDMGVEPFLLASSLIGVIAQRLVRVLCKDCKKEYIPSNNECKILEVDANNPPTIYQAVGCNSCAQTGYVGRKGIYEIILIDPELKYMIHNNASEAKMNTHVRGYLPSIRQDGLKLILAGTTTIEEVIQVTND